MFEVVRGFFWSPWKGAPQRIRTLRKTYTHDVLYQTII